MNAENTATITPEQLSSLKCPACARVNTAARRNRNDNSPARSSAIVPTFTMPEPATSASASTYTSINKESIGKLLDQKLCSSSKIITDLRAALTQDLKAIINLKLNSVLKELKEDFTKTTDFLEGEIKDLQNKMKEKDKTITALQNEQKNLKDEMVHLQTNLSTLEKISRNRNIEIQAVPECSSENVVTMFKTLCNKINLPITDADIHSCRRVAKVDTTSNRPRNIVVTLASPRVRDDVLSASFRHNKINNNDKLNTSHLGIQGASRRIYVTEHLSPEAKKLHAATRQFAKDNNFKYVCVGNHDYLSRYPVVYSVMELPEVKTPSEIGETEKGGATVKTE